MQLMHVIKIVFFPSKRLITVLLILEETEKRKSFSILSQFYTYDGKTVKTATHLSDKTVLLQFYHYDE